MNKAYNQILNRWLKTTLGCAPKQLSIYVEALTHPSFSNENKLSYNYQRLEFLGDSILNFLVAEYLYNKYKKQNEGALTISRSKMVQGKAEVYAAKRINLQNFILLGKGLNKAKCSDKIIEDGFEALIGAIYLDLGLDAVNKFLRKTIFSYESHALLQDTKDYKTLVQEALVKHNVKNSMYRLKQINKETFEAKLVSHGITYGHGIGHNKKEAMTFAAKNAYDKLVKREK